MHTFYINIPWIIDQSDYNCSSRTLAEWKARGSVNSKQGAYFLTTGIFYLIIYTLSLIGMVRAKLLHIPCYRLMFFNGIIDMMDVLGGSLTVAYLHFSGGVFCSNVLLSTALGHTCWSLWIGMTIICVALALNRLVEMVPSMNRLRFLFEGRNVYMWMALCVAIMLVRPFVSRPILFNSKISSFFMGPIITDDMSWEVNHYTSLLLPIHNISFIIALIVLYTALCYNVYKMRKLANGKIDKMQVQLFLQALVICSSTTVASILYVVVEFSIVPKAVIILANATWQLSHGIHGLVYLFLNNTIRREVLKLFSLDAKVGAVAPTTS